MHLWPGDAAQEMAGYFDQVLDKVADAAGIEIRTANTGSRQPATAVVPENDPVVGEDTAVTDHIDD